MQQAVLDRVQAAIRASRPDVLVLSSPQNFSYVTGFTVPSHALFPWRLTMVVVPSKGDPAIVVLDMEASTVRQAAPGTELRVWGEFTSDPMETLANLLEDLGHASASVGVEDDHLAYADLTRLKTKLPAADLVPAGPFMSALRVIKTQEEVALLRRLSRTSDGAIRDAYEGVAVGATEMDIAAGLTRSASI